MTRYNFAAQKVHQHATHLLNSGRIATPPPWFAAISASPPPPRLVRPAMQRTQRAGKKASRMFQPVKLQYQEDELRWEYFNDHPWELSRPRVVLENDGRDGQKWDWSLPLDYALSRPKVGQVDDFGRGVDEWDQIQITQSMRPINGEAVVQRQLYLLQHSETTSAAAYDQARKELYRYKHAKEVGVRVAREEALSQGAYFGPGPLEVGMHLEDKAYMDFRSWAEKEIILQKQAQSSAYSGGENEEASEEADSTAQDEASGVDASKGAKKGKGSGGKRT